jgi:trimethylamine:corrinoid methyltransferase-like protein
LIEKVGPGGYFVAEPASAALCRKEVWLPELSDRKPYQFWEAAGGLSMDERIRLRVKDIYEHYQVTEIPQPVQDQIQKILKWEEARVGG